VEQYANVSESTFFFPFRKLFVPVRFLALDTSALPRNQLAQVQGLHFPRLIDTSQSRKPVFEKEEKKDERRDEVL